MTNLPSNLDLLSVAKLIIYTFKIYCIFILFVSVLCFDQIVFDSMCLEHNLSRIFWIKLFLILRLPHTMVTQLMLLHSTSTLLIK